jgi:hypothetical protein
VTLSLNDPDGLAFLKECFFLSAGTVSLPSVHIDAHRCTFIYQLSIVRVVDLLFYLFNFRLKIFLLLIYYTT